MAKPKKKKEKRSKPAAADKPSVVDGPEEDPSAGDLTLTEKELMQLELEDARMNLAQAHIDKFTYQETLKKIEMGRELDVIRMHKGNCKGDLKAARERNNELIKAAEERLGIKLADYTVREDGSLNYVADDGESAAGS
jgi:hypothetical protein